MNRTVTLAFASLLAVAPAAGVAYAQEVMPTTPDTMATGSIVTDDVSVVYRSSLASDESDRSNYAFLESKVNDPAALEQTQAELQSEPGLADALLAKNVQLQNVVHIQTAGNGGKIVYVK